MTSLRHVMTLRRVFLVLHAVAVVVIVVLVYNRSVQTVAATDLPANHRLTPADLQTAATKPLIGHYLREPVKAGQRVTAAMVTQKVSVAKPAGTIAAIVTLPAATAKQRGMVEGAAVTIARAAPPLQASGTVIRRDCDDAHCVFFIALPKLQGQTIDPDAFAGADLVPAAPAKGP